MLCEKPMAATARQARQMFTAAEENGVVLMEAMRSLYAPGFARLRGLVQAVGPVRRATPVSYTHLDVYKRQIMRRAFLCLWCWKTM